MSFKLSAGAVASYSLPVSGDDFRATVLQANEARRQTRRKELAAQTSQSVTAHDRIRMWEHLHALHLPTGLDHKLVRVIAEQTNLSVADIQAEQRRRAAPSAAPFAHAAT